MGDGGSGSKGGKTSVSKPQGGSKNSTGGDAGAGSGGASTAGQGPSAAGSGDEGGTSGAAPSDGGSSGAAAGDAGAGGEGGASVPAPNDEGCLERPWTGNVGDLSEQVPGLDCSSCSNASELGYTVPAFCAEARTCTHVLEASELSKDGALLLLPPESKQKAPCREQPCENSEGKLEDLPGYRLQFIIRSAASGVRVEVDENRRVLQTAGDPFDSCDDPPRCAAWGAGFIFRVVAKAGAPRGWVRISIGQGLACE